jgi:hypothetical protein
MDQDLNPADPTSAYAGAGDDASRSPVDATADARDAELADLRRQLADAQSAGSDVPSIPADPKDAEIAELRAQLADANDALERHTATQRTVSRNRAATLTAAPAAAEQVDGYTPKVRDIVDFTAVDPLDESEIRGVGVVIDVSDKHAIIAPLQPLHLPVTELTPRHRG